MQEHESLQRYCQTTALVAAMLHGSKETYITSINTGTGWAMQGSRDRRVNQQTPLQCVLLYVAYKMANRHRPHKVLWSSDMLYCPAFPLTRWRLHAAWSDNRNIFPPFLSHPVDDCISYLSQNLRRSAQVTGGCIQELIHKVSLWLLQ